MRVSREKEQSAVPEVNSVVRNDSNNEGERSI